MVKPMRKDIKDKRFDFFISNLGNKVVYKKRCLLCKYADLDLIEGDLICENRENEFVEDNFFCDDFKLQNDLKEDILSGGISAV